MVNNPKLSLSFFAPKYWLTWCGMVCLYLISWLPFGVQLSIGKVLGQLASVIAKKRRRIAEVNVKLCFPELCASQQKKLTDETMQHSGIAMLETGMAWWWPNWRVKKHLGAVKGLELIDQALSEGKGILLLVPHVLHLEMAGRMLAQHVAGVGFYRPHNNPLMEYFITKGRLKYNEYLIGKRDVKGLLKALRKNKLCYYLPDQDYGRQHSVFAPFFAMKDTATITATSTIAAGKKTCTLGFKSRRNQQGLYDIEITTLSDSFPTGDELADATEVNQHIEQAVEFAPAQYMWLHRRFKTRPDPNSATPYE